ncbi:MAG: radical SAM protein [Myxococcota bacterium]
MSAPNRVVLEVTRACDGACRFCAQAGMPERATDDGQIDAAIRAAGAAGHEVTFVGGEPTGHPRLASWVAEARAAGCPAVGVQTHGRALADRALASSLLDAGLTDVHLSIHGARPGVHDYHVGAPGGLAATQAGLSTLRALGRERGEVPAVVATTVVTRSNFRVLSELPAALAGWGIAAWCLQWPEAVGSAGAAFDRIVPRFGLAVPFALHAAATAARGGLSVFVAGVPVCVMGPMRRVLAPSPSRSYAPVCASCEARPACCGADSRYLERFGAQELRPAARAQTRSSEPLRRLFVGVGARAPAVAAPTHDSPGRARARLPILGRPDPARAEVRGRARDAVPAESLFPELLDEPSEP